MSSTELQTGFLLDIISPNFSYETMMNIYTYQDKDRAEWESLVEAGNNGTIFHLRKFLSYHPKDRFIDHSLIFEKKDKPFVLFPAAERIEQGKKILVSHPGSSYGSFVTPVDLSFSDANHLVKTLKAYVKNIGMDGIRLTLPPAIYNRRVSNYIDFSLLSQGFTYAKREVSSILFIEPTIEDQLKKFRSSHRRAIRKAERSGVMIRQSDDFASFYQILKKNLSIRHGVTPTHTLEELEKLKALFPDKIHLFGAFFEEKMIAGVVNFICNNDVVLAFYISHDENYQETRALNLLFYNIFEWAIREKVKVFDFGIFTVSGDPNFGLARFKENFGSSGMFRDTLEITL